MLTGGRVVLRPFRPADHEAIWRAKLDPMTWARTSAAPLVPLPLQTHLESATSGLKPTDAMFAVDLDDVLVGQGLIFHVDDLARTAELGISLLPEARGRGLCRDVVQVLLDYAFRSRNLRRVHLQTLAGNEAALRCYRAAGFVEEGRLREHAWVEGAYDDVVLMAVLQTDRPSR